MQNLDNFLQKIFGNLFNVIKGYTLCTDRYIWLKKNLPHTLNGEKLLDVGCGSGAFTIKAAQLGYYSEGLSWDEVNQNKAISRSKLLRVNDRTSFPLGDARKLNEFYTNNSFDFIINFENIEHILDDRKLFKDIFNILKPGGILLLTTPYYFYKPMSKNDSGPFLQIEDGGHVRRGYTKSMLYELSVNTGFRVEKINFCSGFASQVVTKIQRFFIVNLSLNSFLAWLLTLPLRPFAFVFELFPKFLKGRCYTICLIAQKPRFIN